MRERRHKISILGIKGEVSLWLWKVLRWYEDIFLIFGHKFNDLLKYKNPLTKTTYTKAYSRRNKSFSPISTEWIKFIVKTLPAKQSQSLEIPKFHWWILPNH